MPENDMMCQGPQLSEWGRRFANAIAESIRDPEMETFAHYEGICMSQYGVTMEELFNIYFHRWLENVRTSGTKEERLASWDLEEVEHFGTKLPVLQFDDVDRFMKWYLEERNIPYNAMSVCGLEDVCMRMSTVNQPVLKFNVPTKNGRIYPPSLLETSDQWKDIPVVRSKDFTVDESLKDYFNNGAFVGISTEEIERLMNAGVTGYVRSPGVIKYHYDFPPL